MPDSINNRPIKVLFFGTPIFAAYGLEQLLASSEYEIRCVISQPDRPAGRGARVQVSPVKETAMKASIDVLQPENIRRDKDQFIADLKSYGPFDIAVVIAFGQILPLDILSIPTHGSVNVHASLLPRWRGAAPIQRAIMSGDQETGICLMKMDAGLDTGPVYSTVRLPIEKNDTFGSLHDRLKYEGGELLKRDLAAIARGDIPAVPQEETGVTYAKKIDKAESRINWQESSKNIANLVRGLSPAPGAYAELKGKRIKILQAEERISTSNTNDLPPGTISLLDKNLLEIKCGSGAISVKEIQVEGKRRMSVSEFVLGTSLELGMMFE